MPEQDQNRHRFLPAAALIALLLAVILVYLPGLGSGLYVDDYYNLHLLSTVKDEGILAFVGSGVSGPLGRPLSYLSFALQAGSWPANIAAFKWVNLLLHLGNGLLVFFICRACAPFLGLSPQMRDVFCIFSTGIWLVHPMHLTTVLYVVQRMAELSALFVFLGVLGYLAGRRAVEAGRLRAGYVGMTVAVGAGTLAAMLCKENGILLPVLVLVLDWTLLQDRPRPAAYRIWRFICLILPAVLIGGWLLWQAWGSQDTFQWRPYSMYQKSLTEAAVLLVYIWDLFVPRPSAFGLFHDDFPVAAGLLGPAWVLPAVVAIVAMIVCAFLLRRRHPVFAFGVLWFFGAHLLESTHLNLEIYFEHRNYLPSVGLLTLVPWLLARQAPRLQSSSPVVAALCLYLVLTGWVSVQNSLLWRQPLALAEEAVRIHPESRGALAQLGSRYIGAGNLDAARGLYQDMAVRYPTAILPALRLAAISGCIRNEPVAAEEWERLESLADSGGVTGFEFLAELNTQVSVISAGECGHQYAERLTGIVERMTTNPNLPRERGALHELAGALRLTMGDIPATLRHYRLAKETVPTLHRHWLYIELLLKLGRPRAAGDEMAAFRATLKQQPVAWLAYRDKLAVARKLLDTMNGPKGEQP
ncbi:MAG: hypothetical protein A3H91_02875 [Gammaproteobacteria bacterium RIFCSPLOWO2_02_FULL_61_13]|nr:MAG: hypothetical protein A3H91_02875 [Gammaproteobacteria bacterium RIFCSPLOWO2_02_FULL_61_13]